MEILLVVQLQDSLQFRGEEEEKILLAGHSVSTYRQSERRAAGLQLHMYDWQRTRAGERELEEERGEGDDEPREVRLARELHDLRMDRLGNFGRRTGSLLVDQQQRNAELRNRGTPGLADGGAQPQAGDSSRNGDKLLLRLKATLQERSKNVTHLAQDLSLMKVLKQSFDERERLGEALDELYDILYEGGRREPVQQGEYEDYYEEEYLTEEKEEDYGRVFDPDDFIIGVGADGKVNITRKQLEPEILLENLTLPVRDMTPLEKEGLNILLTIRFSISRDTPCHVTCC